MSDNKLTIKIDADPLTVEAFLSIVENTVSILKSIEKQMTGENTIEWKIENLRWED